MECPNCKLINPDEAQRCDCGYDFGTKTREESFLAINGKPKISTTGSTIALILGALFWIASFGSEAAGRRHMAHMQEMNGLEIIFGTLSYRSLKRTRFGVRNYSHLCRTFEILGLLAVAIVAIAQWQSLTRVTDEPVQYIGIPAAAVIAYCWLFAKTRRRAK